MKMISDLFHKWNKEWAAACGLKEYQLVYSRNVWEALTQQGETFTFTADELDKAESSADGFIANQKGVMLYLEGPFNLCNIETIAVSRFAFMVLKGKKTGNVIWTTGGDYRTDWYVLLYECDTAEEAEAHWHSYYYNLNTQN
jgi:hypothetical protein